jgi:hypothetical protein
MIAVLEALPVVSTLMFRAILSVVLLLERGVAMVLPARWASGTFILWSRWPGPRPPA